MNIWTMNISVINHHVTSQNVSSKQKLTIKFLKVRHLTIMTNFTV